jgi:hypothetical protein
VAHRALIGKCLERRKLLPEGKFHGGRQLYLHPGDGRSADGGNAGSVVDLHPEGYGRLHDGHSHSKSDGEQGDVVDQLDSS